MKRLILVEEDAESCRRISEQLHVCGFDIAVTRDTDLSRDVLSRFDLAILDVVSRPMNSVESLRTIRRYSNMPILILSQCGDLADCVVSLELGADDYLVKPVDARELIARINAALRRTSGASPSPDKQPQTLSVGDIEMHVAARRVIQSGAKIELTPVEFELLKVLLESAGALVSREVISREVLGRQYSSHVRSIDVHISGLRRKLGHYHAGELRIRTIRGYGYIYADGYPAHSMHECASRV